MWNYLFFIAYLKWKDETDYSGIESYVAGRMEEDDLSWVPFNQARELKYLEENESKKDS
jgi:inositol 1,4,5-triphosphate receptor type 1/inositol 1,4,5-triphosphate receptor type 3